MLANLISEKYLFYLFYAFSIIGFVGLWFSPFLVSLSTGLIALSVLPFLPSIWRSHKLLIVLMLAMLGLVLFDFMRTENHALVSAKLLLIIGFIFMQLAALHHLKDKTKESVWLILVFSCIVLVVNCIAVGNYWANKAYYDAMLLQSKAIPVLQMHHIHFGILNGLMLLSLGGLYLYDQFNFTQKKLAIVLFLGILIGFHVLGSRTGLLSFYVATSVGLLLYAIHFKKYMVLVKGGLIIVVALSAAFFLSTSFKNKISNSIEDYESWSQGEDINYKSMAMRLEAYKACFGIIKEHPLLGVGAGSQEEALQKMYDKQNSVLYQENRVGPHNQILEFGVKYGLFGMAIVLGFFGYFFRGSGTRSYVFVSVLIMLFTASQLESLWERQGSIFFMTLFIGLAYHLFRQKQNIIQE